MKTTLSKYNIVNKNISTILHLPKTAVETQHVPNVVKVNEWIYITNFKENKSAMKLNLSESSLTWKKVKWKNKYKNKKYTAIKDSILAVGSPYNFVYKYTSTFQIKKILKKLPSSKLKHAVVKFCLHRYATGTKLLAILCRIGVTKLDIINKDVRVYALHHSSVFFAYIPATLCALRK